MRSDCLLYLVSPITHKLLYQEGEKLSTLDKTETYSVVNDVPILLTDEISADWRREILEVLFWQYPWVIEEIYAKLDESTSVSEVFVEYIKCFLKDKAGIMSAIRAYSYEKTDKWIVSNSGRLGRVLKPANGNSESSEIQDSEERICELLVPSGNPAELLQAVEKALDDIAEFV